MGGGTANGSTMQMGQQGGSASLNQPSSSTNLQSIIAGMQGGQQQNPFTQSGPLSGAQMQAQQQNPFTSQQSAGGFNPFSGLQNMTPPPTAMQATPKIMPVGGTSNSPMFQLPQMAAPQAQAPAAPAAPTGPVVPPNAHSVTGPSVGGTPGVGSFYAAPSGMPVDAQGNIIMNYSKISDIHDFLNSNPNVAKAPSYSYSKTGQLITG